MIYVDPVNGNDNNNGTSTDMAAGTISKVRDIIRGICENMTSDIYVYLRGGTHTLTSTFNLTTAHSGTNGYSVIY